MRFALYCIPMGLETWNGKSGGTAIIAACKSGFAKSSSLSRKRACATVSAVGDHWAPHRKRVEASAPTLREISEAAGQISATKSGYGGCERLRGGCQRVRGFTAGVSIGSSARSHSCGSALTSHPPRIPPLSFRARRITGLCLLLRISALQPPIRAREPVKRVARKCVTSVANARCVHCGVPSCVHISRFVRRATTK